MIIFVFVIGVQAKVLGDDVRTVGTERLCLAALDVFAFGITFPVSVFATVKTLAGLLGGDIGA